MVIIAEPILLYSRVRPGCDLKGMSVGCRMRKEDRPPLLMVLDAALEATFWKVDDVDAASSDMVVFVCSSCC